MLGIDRRAARYAWTAALVVLLLYVVYLLRKTLFVYVISLLFGYLLTPLVDFLDRVLPTSRTRTPALVLAYILFVGMLVVAGVQIGTRVADQANRLTQELPALLARWQQPGKGASPTIDSLKGEILAKVQQQIQNSSKLIVEYLPKAGVTFMTVASDVVYVVIIPILAFFFLKDARALRQQFLETIEDGPRRELLEDILADVHLLLAHYMRALVILSAATFISYTIFLLILGVPYTVLLAVVAALLEFIPMIGALVAVVAIVLVAGLSGLNVWPILIFVAVYRVFQDYVLSPHIMGAGVQMHPLLVLFGVFAGAEIAGIPGAFLSVPVLALARVVWVRFRKARAAARSAPATSV
jgi:predicted PurR-regulated permease PerM